MLPLNYEIWAIDIPTANAAGVANWEKVVDYVNDYEIPNGISPDNLYNLSERIRDNQDLANLFEWGESRKAGAEPTNANGHSTFCSMTTSEIWEKDDCFGSSHLPNPRSSPGKWLFDIEIGDWVKEVTSTLKRMANPQPIQ